MADHAGVPGDRSVERLSSDATKSDGVQGHTKPFGFDVAAGRIVFDVTTLLAARGPAHGITRLVGETLGALVASVPRLALCAYDQGRRRFRAVQGDPRELLAAMAASSERAALEIEEPRAELHPIGDPSPGLLTRAYFALPHEMRVAARRSVSNLGLALSDARRMVRPVSAGLSRTNTTERRVKLGATIDFTSRDVLFQGGALWGSHGIAEELRRLKAGHVQIVSLVYDMIPILRPEFFDPTMAGRFLGWALATLTTSEHVVAISETTRRDVGTVAARYDLACPRLSVLRLGDDGLGLAPETIDPAVSALADKPFVLCLGTLEIRKNHRLLHQVWRRLSHDDAAPRLVIVGQHGWLAEETEALLRRDRAVARNIALVRGASDRHVAWLLSRALFTVYPSFYEGWGLPVAESLAAGRIVVASDVPAVREAGQGLALHLPPDDVPQWAETIRSLRRDADRRRRIEADIAARFTTRTWAQAASDLAQTIERARTDRGARRVAR